MTICIPQGDRRPRQGAGLVKTIPRNKKGHFKNSPKQKGLQKRFVCKEKRGNCCGEAALSLYCPVFVPFSVPLLFPYFSMVFSVYGTVGQRKRVNFRKRRKNRKCYRNCVPLSRQTRKALKNLRFLRDKGFCLSCPVFCVSFLRTRSLWVRGRGVLT